MRRPDSNPAFPPARGERLATQLRRALNIRLLGIGSFLVSFFLLRVFLGAVLATPSKDRVIYGFLIVALALNLLFRAVLEWSRVRTERQAALHFASDLLITTVLVYLFGGASSPFTVFYFVVVILAATLLSRRAALLAAVCSWLLYALAALTRHFGWIPGSSPALESIADVNYGLVFHLVGFLLVAVLASRLARDVSRVARDLATLQNLHRDIVESIPSGLMTLDPSGTVITANIAARRILGSSGANAVGRSIQDTGLFAGSRWSDVQSAARDPQARNEVVFDRDGEERPIGFSLSEITSPEGEPTALILIFQDLYDWHKLQEEVQLKDRMAAIGEMAAGIAHEIGNPLAALSGSAQMLQPSLEEGSSRRTLLDIILRESRRLDRIIKGFLQFARPKERASVRFDIAELLRNNVELLRNSEEVLPGHRIHLDLDVPSAQVIADPDQISQIFWNLVRNGLRALDQAGDLYLQGRLSDDAYRIRFSDTGKGMTEQARAQIFHPFRSSFHGGTGIGMAIVYRIVEEHGGRLSVDSEAGRGTVVTVELPAAEQLTAVGP